MSVNLKTNYLVVSADEVTTIDAQRWINIHVYVMKNWQRILILLTFKRVEVGVTSNNIKTMNLDAMATYKGNLSNNDMASKWICLAM